MGIALSPIKNEMECPYCTRPVELHEIEHFESHDPRWLMNCPGCKRPIEIIVTMTSYIVIEV